VTISYTLTDTENDTLSISGQYSTDGGSTWKAATLSGTTSGITSAGYSGSVIWKSHLNEPTINAFVKFRLTPSDLDVGTLGETGNFILSNTNVAPTAVTLNTPASVEETTLDLSWGQSIDEDFASYKVYRSTSPGVSESSTLLTTITSKTTTTYTATGLTKGTQYYFKVYVVDVGGLSTGSNEVAITTKQYWRTVAPMPTGRHGLAVGAVNGKIYAIGGNGSSGSLTMVEEYNPATNQWAAKAPMPTGRAWLAVGVVNNKIYAIGGYGSAITLTTVEEYDPATDTWTTRAPMPTARYILAVGVVNNKIYAIGGSGSPTPYHITVEEHDPATNQWVTKASMLTGRSSLAVGVVNNKIYAVGGSGSSGSLTTVEEYDSATNQWMTKAPMPMGRYSLAVGVVNGKVYAIGGRKDGTCSECTTVEEYDPVMNQWTTKAPMPTGRAELAVGMVNNKLYAIGGGGPASSICGYYCTTVEEASFYDGPIPATPPASPTLNTPTSITGSSVTLSWSQSAESDFASYKIYRDNVAPQTGKQAVNESDTLVATITDKFQTSFTDTGLNPTTTYYYKVYTYNTSGLSAWSNEVSATTLNVPPQSVTLNTPTGITEASLTLSWNQNSDSDFASYKVYRSTSPGVTTSSTLAATITNISTVTYQDTGLLDNTTYYYKVFVFDQGGLSTGSNEVSAATLNVPPQAVTLNAPTGVTETSLTLSWGQSPNADFASYKIYRSTSAGVTTSSTLVATITVKATTSYTDTGLTGNTTYYYKVFVNDTTGLSTGSNEISVSTDVAPTAVTLNTPTNPFGSVVDLSWSQSGAGDFASYKVYRSTSAGVTTSSTLVATITGKTTTSYRVETLNSGTLYYFKVYVYDQGGQNTGSNEVSITTGQAWVTKAPMPTGRGSLAVGVVNNMIYAIGGYNGSSYFTIVEEYDPATNQWTTKAPMPTARRGLATGVVNNKIYAIGGSNGGSQLATVEEYDPATNTWTTKASMPTSRGGLAISVVNNKIYAIGGGYGSYLTTVEEYDPATNQWTTKAPMLTGRESLAVGVVNNKIYAVGGFNMGSSPSVYLPTVEEYDPATNQWTTKTPMPTGRDRLAIGVVNNKIYAIGGSAATAPTIVEEYDSATNQWMTKAPMPTGRNDLAVGVVNNKIYAIGGCCYLTTVEEGSFYDGPIPPTLPLSLTLNTPTSITGSSITLSWSQSAESDFASYKIYRDNVAPQPGKQAVNESDTLVATITDKTQTSFTDTGLSKTTTYYYKVYTYNTSGLSAWSNEVSVTTTSAGVSITSHTNNQIVTSASQTISGNVFGITATSGTLTLNGTNIPISITGGNFSQAVALIEGNNTISVTAGSETTGIITIKLDTIKPTSTISVADKTVYPTSTTKPITISGTATDGTAGSGVTKVEISLDGGTTWANAILSGSSWNYAWTPTAQGGYLVKTRATDNAGWVEDVGAGIVLFYSDAVVFITSHIDNQIVTTPGQTFVGTVIDTTITSADLVVNGATTSITVSSGSFSQTVTLAEGENTVRVVAGGNSSAQIRVRLDTIRPTSTFTTADKTLYPLSTPKPITITGSASDGTNGSGVAKVEISLDGGATWINATFSGSSWNYAWSPTAQAGYSIKSRATDNAGWVENVGAGIRLFYSDFKVIITSHSDNQIVATPNQTFTGAVLDTAVTSADLFVNGATTAMAVSGGAFSQTITLSEGDNTIRAVAVGDSSNQISVKVDTIRPTSSIAISDKTVYPISTTKPITISGTATDGVTGSGITKVEISLDGGATWAGTTLSGSSSSSSGAKEWSYAWTPAAQGGYRVKTRATDAAGWVENVGAGILLFYTDAMVSITSPVDGQYVTTPNQTITGVVVDNTLTSGTLTFNGTNIPISITGGSFGQGIVLAEGNNTISVTAGGHSFGPIAVKLDTTPPTEVAGLTSTTHQIKTYSKEKVITVSWGAATDATSGLDGYSILWDTSPTTLPDTTKDIAGSVTSTSSSTLPDGIKYYFHIRSVDKVGNYQKDAVHIGPFYIDAIPLVLKAKVLKNPIFSNQISIEVSASEELDGVPYVTLTPNGSSQPVLIVMKRIPSKTAYLYNGTYILYGLPLGTAVVDISATDLTGGKGTKQVTFEVK
jgi:fibronectin type 3 domain-containing protein